MKIEKNKIVFAAVLATILLFLISYAVMLSSDNEFNDENLKHIKVPTLGDTEPEYHSKLDALNDLNDVKERNAPSIYDEKFIDSLGYFDPDLEEKEKEHYVDSLFAIEEFKKPATASPIQKAVPQEKPMINNAAEQKAKQKIALKEMGLEHQLFFASNPKKEALLGNGKTDSLLYAVVDGDQVVKSNSRLRMRLLQSSRIQGNYIPKNTLIYGLVGFQPNRVIIAINHVQDYPIMMKAYDLEDGMEGIYVENNFRANVSNEVLSEVVDDINIAGVPQLGGIKKIFQRDHRNVKVTILNNYQLTLKPNL